MKSRVLMIVGVLAVLLGGLWALQGSDVLGGSGMSGSSTWLVIGIVVLLAGLLLVALGARGRKRV